MSADELQALQEQILIECEVETDNGYYLDIGEFNRIMFNAIKEERGE